MPFCREGWKRSGPLGNYENSGTNNKQTIEVAPDTDLGMVKMKNSTLFTKKVLLILATTFICYIGYAQDAKDYPNNGGVAPAKDARYELYKTQNMWTFLKLDTATGLIWQVQYSTNDIDKIFQTYLNLVPEASGGDAVNGRFKLYPTDNMYNFIMLDMIDGRAWQVQWSTDYQDRVIIPIK